MYIVWDSVKCSVPNRSMNCDPYVIFDYANFTIDLTSMRAYHTLHKFGRRRALPDLRCRRSRWEDLMQKRNCMEGGYDHGWSEDIMTNDIGNHNARFCTMIRDTERRSMQQGWQHWACLLLLQCKGGCMRPRKASATTKRVTTAQQPMAGHLFVNLRCGIASWTCGAAPNHGTYGLVANLRHEVNWNTVITLSCRELHCIVNYSQHSLVRIGYLSRGTGPQPKTAPPKMAWIIGD